MNTKTKIFCGLILLTSALLLPISSSAQTTLVTATVTDPNGLPYAGGTLKAVLLDTASGIPVGSPTVTISSQAQCTAARAGTAPCQIPIQGTFQVTLDSTGSIPGGGIILSDNSLVTPAGTQWVFTGTISPGIPPPQGFGPQTFTTTITISGASQNITSNLTAVAPALSFGGPGPNTPGIPIYNGPTEIYAANYGVKAKAIRFSDCSFVNTSRIVNCGISPGESDPCFTPSMLNTGPGGGGWLVFGTNGPPTTPGPTATAIIPVGTITAVNSCTQIQVSIAATAGCTSVNGTDLCQILISPFNDTTALQSAVAAAFSTAMGPACGHLALPQGNEWLDHRPSVGSGVGCDFGNEANGTAAGAYVTGAGYNQTVLFPVPNADWVAGGANSGAFFFTTATRGTGWHYRDFSIDGLGQYAALAGTGPSEGALFLNQNSSAINVGCFGWGIGTGIIAVAGDAAEAVLDHDMIGGCGSTSPVSAGSYTRITNSAMFWSIGTANLIVSGIHVTSVNNTYDFPDAVSGQQVQVNGSATTEFFSTDDLYLSFPQNTQIAVKVTANGTAHINHARIANPLGANDIGLSVDAGSSLYLLDTKVLFNANSGQALSIAGTVFDLGGNTFQTATANSITGSWFGSASTTGTAFSTASFALTSGWGASTKTSGAGDSHQFNFVIAGAAGAASPVVTITFPTAYVVAPSQCTIQQTSGTFAVLTNPVISAITTTTFVITWTGTPNASTFGFSGVCGP